MSFLIPTAMAATGTGAASGSSNLSFLLFIGVFFAFFYFFLIRPQSKRQKEMRAMLSAVAKGDEVVVSGGIMGVVTLIDEAVVGIEIAKGVEIKVQKAAISACLPKGTLKN